MAEVTDAVRDDRLDALFAGRWTSDHEWVEKIWRRSDDLTRSGFRAFPCTWGRPRRSPEPSTAPPARSTPVSSSARTSSSVTGWRCGVPSSSPTTRPELASGPVHAHGARAGGPALQRALHRRAGPGPAGVPDHPRPVLPGAARRGGRGHPRPHLRGGPVHRGRRPPGCPQRRALPAGRPLGRARRPAPPPAGRPDARHPPGPGGVRRRGAGLLRRGGPGVRVPGTCSGCTSPPAGAPAAAPSRTWSWRCSAVRRGSARSCSQTGPSYAWSAPRRSSGRAGSCAPGRTSTTSWTRCRPPGGPRAWRTGSSTPPMPRVPRRRQPLRQQPLPGAASPPRRDPRGPPSRL